jgi:hypothetical protein
MSRKNERLVSMLERAVAITYGQTQDDMSGIKPDKSELRARRIVKKLEKLARKDPSNDFGKQFTRLQLEILKHLGMTTH